MGKRTFGDQAAVIATGVQTQQDRFGKRLRRSDIEDLIPSIAPWRSQLTGLSQTQNLYFVAYSDKIYVYVPQYSTQALPRDPALIVTSQPSRHGLHGYLDRRNPHSINNLVVSLLGTEEVVAVVRDDGDVDAFLVRHIVQALGDYQASIEMGIPPDLDEPRPFFQSNVGMSAWGLAIHAQARVVAVSANTHSITIFKFGLVGASGENSKAPDRSRDVTEQVLNGTSNIPHIAFCNTGDDPEARWLLTTDITGYCRSIDLFEMRTVQTFRFGSPTSSEASNDHDPINSGWFMGFLDRRSFLQQDNIYAALGMGEDDPMDGTSFIWDIGATVAHVPDTNRKFSVSRNRRRSGRRSTSQSVSTSGIQSPTTESDTADMAEQSPSIHNAETLQDLDSPELDNIDDGPGSEMEESRENQSEGMDESDSGESTYLVDDMDEGTEDSPSFNTMYGGRRVYGNAPRAYQPYAGVCDLPCPILHASVRNVYLLQPGGSNNGALPVNLPTVGFTNALHQLVQGQFSYLNVFERLNMSAYIPTLGIIIFASQKGRAMVLSLTKLINKSARYPSYWKKHNIPPFKTTYTMRIECILPFAQQEEAEQRPFAPLAGIATGPMQGTEHLPDGQKRWRLMMYYADHTVLSYEVGRRRHRDSAVDIQGVVV